MSTRPYGISEDAVDPSPNITAASFFRSSPSGAQFTRLLMIRWRLSQAQAPAWCSQVSTSFADSGLYHCSFKSSRHTALDVSGRCDETSEGQSRKRWSVILANVWTVVGKWRPKTDPVFRESAAALLQAEPLAALVWILPNDMDSQARRRHAFALASWGVCRCHVRKRGISSHLLVTLGSTTATGTPSAFPTNDTLARPS